MPTREINEANLLSVTIGLVASSSTTDVPHEYFDQTG
jgi:hypothetical protein